MSDILETIKMLLPELSWNTFLAGAWGIIITILAGCGGKYFADKYTDKRRGKECDNKNKQMFVETHKQMPELLQEMKRDLDANPVVREFVAIKKPWIFNSQQIIFKYYFEEHENLLNKLTMLENYNLVKKLSDVKYRFTEAFVNLLQEVR